MAIAHEWLRHAKILESHIPEFLEKSGDMSAAIWQQLYFLGNDKLGSTILVELSSLISLPIPTAKILTADRYSHIFHQNKVTSIERVEGSDSRSSALQRV